MDNMNRMVSTNKMVKVAVLSAVAFVLMMIESPAVFSTFLKMDFSDIIAVIGAFALGPVSGVVIQLLKNFLHLAISQTSGVGELGNFIVGGVFVYVSARVYWRNKTKKQAVIALITGTAFMVLVGMVANYYILLPLYANVLGFTTEAVVAATHVVNHFVTDKVSFILFAILPFNLLKGIIVSTVTFLVYKRMSKLLG